VVSRLSASPEGCATRWLAMNVPQALGYARIAGVSMLLGTFELVGEWN